MVRTDSLTVRGDFTDVLDYARPRQRAVSLVNSKNTCTKSYLQLSFEYLQSTDFLSNHQSSQVSRAAGTEETTDEDIVEYGLKNGSIITLRQDLTLDPVL